MARPEEAKRHIRYLAEFWKGKTIADIKPQSCRAYIPWRIKEGSKRVAKIKGARQITEAGVRRELETLNAAVGFWHKEHTLTAKPIVTIPDASPRREEWLTRSEVAKLLWVCRKRKAPQVARFILIAFYTGTRSSAIMGLRWMSSTKGGWIDLQNNLLYRRGMGVRETNKRTPPVRIHESLLPHLKRWQAMDAKLGCTHVVNYEGAEIKKIRRSWLGVRKVVEETGLDKHIVQHTFRHTCVTHLLQAGVPQWEVAGYVGMGITMIQKHYGHHHADYQKAAAARRRRSA